MQDRPDLLPDGTEAVVLDLVEVQNPDEVEKKDGGDDGADVTGRGGRGVLQDLRDGFGHAD